MGLFDDLLANPRPRQVKNEVAQSFTEVKDTLTEAKDQMTSQTSGVGETSPMLPGRPTMRVISKSQKGARP